MRTTKAHLQQLIKVLNNRNPKPGHRYEIEYAYGSPRLILAQTKSPYGARDISPRLPAGQLHIWLNAFLDGLDECRHR
jgi:hypothetical protein